MPLECFTPRFEKGNVFCCSPPAARDPSWRPFESLDHSQLWKDHGAGGRSWERGACVEEELSSHLACEPLPVVPMGLYVQGTKTLGTLRC